MSPLEATRVHEGAKVVSKHTTPPFRPLRVTRVWVNERRTIARFWIASLGAWVDSEGVEMPPPKAKWDGFKWKGGEP